jgi:putative FmdB family regulatory protein
VPTYDLNCTDCSHDFEVFRQGFLRDEDLVCDECGGHHVTQRITGFVTARRPRDAQEPTVTGFRGHGCCGGH